MTDPERLSTGTGFAAQLLRAGAAEQPGDAGLARTLAALGVSGAALTMTTAVNAAAGNALSASLSGGAGLSTGAAASGASGVVSAALLVKWIGIGVVGGVTLAGAASVVTRPQANPPAVVAARRMATAPVSASSPQLGRAEAHPELPAPERALAAAPSASTRAVSAPSTSPELEAELGMPLHMEVAFVDRGRALLRAGRTLEGLALLDGYEREFNAARLLPEVLFLRLEAHERLGRAGEARRDAERLLNGFPRSPHAARARKLLEP